MKKLKQTMKRIATLGLTAVLLVNTVPLEAFAADPAEASYPAFEQSETIDGVKITVGAEEGVFPEGAVLSAEKVSKTREEEALEAVEEERPGEQNVAASYTYDIKVLDKDGNEVQPADESRVKLSFNLEEVADSNLETNIYHIRETDPDGTASGEKAGDDRNYSEETTESNDTASSSEESDNKELIAEKLEVETEGDTATAETDGFSLYTVEFSYNDLQYVMPGDSEVALSEILNKVSLTGEVTNVEVSSPELFSAGKNDSGEWIVTAHRAFSSEEWMKVTINGKEYRITVTDDQETMSRTDLQTLLNNGGTITLDKDVEWKAGETDPLLIPSGKTVTLDLNDHYILYKGTGSAPVIKVNGSLTLKDSKTPKTMRYVTLTDGRATGVSESSTSGAIEVTGGFIAGGNNESNNGGGVYVENSCMFTMEGGTIVGCKAAYGGGVNVNNSGKFTMEDGTIVGCKALYDGGGVFVNNTGNFYMNGGGITNCTAIDSGDKRGGGVFIFSSGKFNMEGGSITDCTADSGGGVYVFGGTFKVSGTPVIRDNKKGSDANNVALNNSKYITVTGALTDGAEIWVNGARDDVIAKPDTPSGSTTAYTITAADVEKFHSDDTSLSPGLDGGNVKFKATLPTATLINTSIVYNGSAFSPTISFEGATLTKDSDYTLSYKMVVDTQETALSSAPKDVGSYKLVVTGKGTYAGKQELDFTITQKPVTVVSGITVKDKEYDGGTTAELITTGAVFEGKCNGDTLTVSDAGAGTFADKDAGASKAVNIDATKFVLGGASAGNYELADSGHQSTATGRISKKSITITGVTANDKEYDGNTTATTVTSQATVTGLVGADTVEFTVDGTFADANKGTDKTVTLSNWSLTSGGTNYEIDAANSQTTTTASITGVQVYIDGVSAQNKVYDGNKTATVTGTAILKKVNGVDTVSGLTVSDITAEFEDKNAGDNKTVTITGGTLSDAENYTLVPERTTGLSANITPASVTITGVFADNKTYDGSTAATVTGTPVINGKIGNDVVTVSAGTAAFDDKNVGNNKTVTFSGFGLTGTDSGNYLLSSQPVNVTASITKATPEITQIPTAGAITYGQTLADSTITGGLVKVGETAIEGSFAWKTGTAKPTVADSGETLYDVVFTPSDTMNYETAECKVTLTVNKADIPPGKITPPTANSLTYTGSAQELINPGAVSDGLGTMKYAFAKVSDTDNPPAAPKEEEAAYNSSVPTAIKGGNYCIWYMVKGDANHKDKTPASIPVTISKADSKSEEMKTIEVQAGSDVPVSVNLKAYLGENASTSEITTDGDGTLTFSDVAMGSDKYTLSFKATSETGGTGRIILKAQTENHQTYWLTVPVEAKAFTTEVKLEEVPGVDSAVEGVVVSGLDAYTNSQTGTNVKVELDVKTENEGSVGQSVVDKISNAVALIFSGVKVSNVKKEYLDISVKKTVDGATSTVTDVGSVIEIAVKYDLSGKFNPVVIREHGGNITKFTALTGPPTSDFSDGTFYVDATTGTIYIYTRFFSTYSIAYATMGTCTVSFDAQGGSAVDPIVVQEGGTIPADKIPVSTKSGYSFDGWFTEPSSGEKLTASTVINRDIYYAHWSSNATPPTPPSPTYYTVSFDMNGHGTAIPAQSVESGGKVTRPADPTAEGFVFTNWYNEASCKNVYDFSTPVTADITLYAGWEAKTEPGPGPDPIIVDGGATWNLYEDASVHEYKIRGINVSGTVANSNAKSKTYYDAKISGSTITVKVTGDRKKAASNATLEFDLGNAGVATYVLPVSYVKPSFKLSSATATIKSGTETVLKTTILTKNSDGIFEPYDMTDVKVSGTGLGTVTKAEDGSVEIKTKAAGKGKISIVKDAWDGAKPVSLAYTVKSSKKDVLSVDLQGLKTVVVNSNAKGQVLSFDMMLNGAVPAEGVVKIVDKKNTGLATIGKGGKLIVAFNDGVKNGTYTITLQAGEAKTNVKVKVSDKALDKAVTAKVQTKYDVVTRQGMVVIPVLKDVSGTIEAVSVAESGFFANLDAAGNIVIDYTGNKYNLKNLNIGTLTLSLKLNGIDEPVKLTLNNVKAKKTTPTVKAGTVTIPKDAETAEGKVIGTANIVSTYNVSSGTYKTISPVKTEIVGTPKDVTAKPNESDMTEIDIYSISKKNVSFKVKLTYAGGVTKTVTVKVNKK